MRWNIFGQGSVIFHSSLHASLHSTLAMAGIAGENTTLSAGFSRRDKPTLSEKLIFRDALTRDPDLRASSFAHS